MQFKIKNLIYPGITAALIVIFSFSSLPNKSSKTSITIIQDSVQKNAIKNDGSKEFNNEKLVLIKKNAHASYYADKFTGRRTASGKIFNNKKYTAAHRKLKFGTKVKVTNEINKKSVIVVITDRGPFIKGRDIDLSKRAFMDIAPKKYGGSIKVTLEEIK